MPFSSLWMGLLAHFKVSFRDQPRSFTDESQFIDTMFDLRFYDINEAKIVAF
jgi:hypothetical protein